MRETSHAAPSEGRGFSPPVQPATCVEMSYKLALMLPSATDSDLTSCDPDWAHYRRAVRSISLHSAQLEKFVAQRLGLPLHQVPQVALLRLPGHKSAGNENVTGLVCLNFSIAWFFLHGVTIPPQSRKYRRVGRHTNDRHGC